jgi:hypothetical protein
MDDLSVDLWAVL